MRSMVLAALAIGAGVLGSHAAVAITLPPPVSEIAGPIILVDQGCGPEFFRAPNGYCYRKREEFRGYEERERRERYGYGYGRPPEEPRPDFYRRPGCPPGTHPTPYGCRPNY